MLNAKTKEVKKMIAKTLALGEVRDLISDLADTKGFYFLKSELKAKVYDEVKSQLEDEDNKISKL